MKKILGILLLLLFVFTIVFSISNDLNITTSDVAPGYASIIPIPPPEPPAQRGV